MKPFITPSRTAVLTALALAAAALEAAPLVYEGFQYPAGSALPGLAGGMGWCGPWIGSAQMTVQPPSLSHPNAKPSMGRALFNPAVGEAFRPLYMAGLVCVPLQNAITPDIWVSWLSQPGGGNAVYALQGFGNGSQVLVDRGSAGPGVVSLYTQAAGASTPLVSGPVSGGAGTTDLYVLRIRKVAGLQQVELWLNPTQCPPVATPLTYLVSTLPAAGSLEMTEFYFRTDPGDWLDEIRIGESCGEVMAGGVVCYPDCNASGSLTIADFGCFQAKFATGDPYADCNGNATLTIADFGCFQSKFSLGCP